MMALPRPVLIAGRCLLWATVVLVFGRGLVSLFAGPMAGGTAPRSAPVPEAGYPVATASAFAARFATDYLTYDEIDPSDWRGRTAPYGTDATANGWDGKGRQTVTTVIPAGVEVESPSYAVVTVTARTGGVWVHLAVPIAAAKGALAIAARPAFVPAPKAGKAPDVTPEEVDAALSEALRPTIEAFFAAYGAGQRAVIAALSADGARLPSLEGARFTLAGIDALAVPKLSVSKTRPGQARSASVAVRWADGRSGATLTQTYRLGLIRDGQRWLVSSLGAARPEPALVPSDQSSDQKEKT